MTPAPHTSKAKVAVLAVLAAAAAGAAVYLVDWGFLRNQITDYQLYCDGQLVDDRCPAGWARGARTVYTVDREGQTVLSQRQDGKEVKLTGCTMGGLSQWKCQSDTKPFVVGFEDGKYWIGIQDPVSRALLPAAEPWLLHVPRWRWLMARESSQPQAPRQP